jgi:hypothetical protein
MGIVQKIWPTLNGLARGLQDLARHEHDRKRPGPTQSTNRVMLRPGQQPIRRAPHDSIRRQPSRHDTWPEWPVEHEHDPGRPVRPDSSRSLPRMDPTAPNPHAECINAHSHPSNPPSPAPALHSPPRHAHCNPTAVP